MNPLMLLFRVILRILRLPATVSTLLTRLILLLGALAAIFQLVIESYRRFPAFRSVIDRLLDAWSAKPPELGGRREIDLDGRDAESTG